MSLWYFRSSFRVSPTTAIVISTDMHGKNSQMFIHARNISWKLLFGINPFYWLKKIIIGLILLKVDGKYNQLSVRIMK